MPKIKREDGRVIATPEGRICYTCNIRKTHDEFPYHPKCSFKSSSTCRNCYAERRRRYRLERLDANGGTAKRLIPSGLKLCCDCGRSKLFSEFCFSVLSKDGFNNRCLECVRHQSRKTNYGITQQQFEEKLKIQSGKCAICQCLEKRKPSGKIIALSVDHNHTTGSVRGLLCFRCNVRIGILENSEWIKLADQYLSKWATDEPQENAGEAGMRRMKRPQ